jgi:gluconolactonase
MSVVKHDVIKPGGLTRILGQVASLERIASGFQFVEGPSWNHWQEYLVFSDITGNRLYRWRQQDGLRILREPSHMANGTCWDHRGRLLICEHAGSRVSRLDDAQQYKVLVSHYQGRELNSPNDIIVKSDGAVYFTDPASGRSAKYGVERQQELDFQGVFRLDPGSGELTLLADDFSKPNGLCFSRDESRLFVNDTDKQHIRVFDVADDGSLRNGALWSETGGEDPGVADGMKVDSEGNLYCCGSGGIHVFDPGGSRLGIIRTPEVAANFTWGGPELGDMYITATHSIYRLRMKIPGHEPLGLRQPRAHQSTQQTESA